jgi:hypothetical protein
VTPNPFHTSVLGRADVLADNNVLPTRTVAQQALLDLVDDDLRTRHDAVNKLARASYWGFDHDSVVQQDGTVTTNILPSLEIKIANLRPQAAFQAEVKQRLSEVGLYRQKAIENQSPNKIVCCHCQSEARHFKGNWRECPTCGRHFCTTCKNILPGHSHRWVKKPGDKLPSHEHGQRACDGHGCGAQTQLVG